MGKKVIAIDLNPLSRTAKKATLTIVDEVTRALPVITEPACRSPMKSAAVWLRRWTTPHSLRKHGKRWLRGFVMLWTERYRPARLEDIRGQDRSYTLLFPARAPGTIPHLMLTGPHGTGKSAAIRCFAERLYGENWEANTSIFQTADLFSQGKKLLEEDERYTHLYQKSQSLIVNFKYILKWYASMRPLDADFKLMVFEDAHALTREAQQGLRRIMEQYSGTCRFIFSTTNQSAIIPAISSRCLPLFFAPVASGFLSRSRRFGSGSSRAHVSPVQMMTSN